MSTIASTIALCDSYRIQTSIVSNPTQPQWARVLMIECWIEALATGVAVTIWSWLKYYALLDRIPHLWQCLLSAIVLAIWSKVFTVGFKMIASQTIGIFHHPIVTGWKKFNYYCIDAIIGTMAIGGGYAIGKRIFNDPNALMGVWLELIILVFGFFTYYAFKLWTNMAMLGMEYKIETKRYIDKNGVVATNISAMDAMEKVKLYLMEAVMVELLTMDTLINSCIPLVIPFAIYPPLVSMITTVWIQHVQQYPGLIEIPIVFMIFVHYEMCDFLCDYIWKKMFQPIANSAKMVNIDDDIESDSNKSSCCEPTIELEDTTESMSCSDE
jgi:hypothetical protein